MPSAIYWSFCSGLYVLINLTISSQSLHDNFLMISKSDITWLEQLEHLRSEDTPAAS